MKRGFRADAPLPGNSKLPHGFASRFTKLRTSGFAGSARDSEGSPTLFLPGRELPHKGLSSPRLCCDGGTRSGALRDIIWHRLPPAATPEKLVKGVGLFSRREKVMKNRDRTGGRACRPVKLPRRNRRLSFVHDPLHQVFRPAWVFSCKPLLFICKP